MAIAITDTIAFSVAPRGRNNRRRVAATAGKSAPSSSSLPVTVDVADSADTSITSEKTPSTELTPSDLNIISTAMTSATGINKTISTGNGKRYVILLDSLTLNQIAYIYNGTLYKSSSHSSGATKYNTLNQPIDTKVDGKIVDENGTLLGFVYNGTVLTTGQEIKEAKSKQIDLTRLAQAVGYAKKACTGIYSVMQELSGTITATKVSSTIGTVASASALGAGLIKNVSDKRANSASESVENDKGIYDNLVDETNTDINTAQIAAVTWMTSYEKDENHQVTFNDVSEGISDVSIHDREEVYSSLKHNEHIVDVNKNIATTAGTVRSVALGGATLTSGVSMATSAVSASKSKNLADMMSDYNSALDTLRTVYADVSTEVASLQEVDDRSTSLYDMPLSEAQTIIENCAKYSTSNIDDIRHKMKASAVVSGVTGTISSIIAGSARKSDKDDAKDKEKKADLVANIAAGVATGTSGTSTMLSVLSSKDMKKDLEKAKKCQNAL